MSTAITDEVLSRENDRIKALIERNLTELREILDESLVHVHTTGRLETYDSYMAGVSNNLEFLTIDRGPLDVRIFGNTAIMTGPLDQRIRIRANQSEMELASIATQVWIKSGDAWKLASFHASRRE